MTDREYEIRTYILDRYNRMRLLVVMDLETYNEALANHLKHLQDEYFNNGFSAANEPYPTEEEIIKQSVNLWKDEDADMDHDDSKEN